MTFFTTGATERRRVGMLPKPQEEPMLTRLRRYEAFTLVELMIVIVIVAVLATVAVPAFSSVMYRARSGEVYSFLGQIKNRQEAYRAEFGQYCAISGRSSWGMFAPRTTPDEDPASWMTTTEWTQLGARPDGAVRCIYSVLAGPPTTRPPGASGGGYDGSDYWFVSQGRCDLNGDGMVATYAGYSAGTHVWCRESRGWD